VGSFLGKERERDGHLLSGQRAKKQSIDVNRLRSQYEKKKAIPEEERGGSDDLLSRSWWESTERRGRKGGKYEKEEKITERFCQKKGFKARREGDASTSY